MCESWKAHRYTGATSNWPLVKPAGGLHSPQAAAMVNLHDRLCAHLVAALEPSSRCNHLLAINAIVACQGGKDVARSSVVASTQVQVAWRAGAGSSAPLKLANNSPSAFSRSQKLTCTTGGRGAPRGSGSVSSQRDSCPYRVEQIVARCQHIKYAQPLETISLSCSTASELGCPPRKLEACTFH